MAIISGTNGADKKWGTGSADTIKAYLGDDVVYGQGGNDVIDLGGGNDKGYGGEGNDRLAGGDGVDFLSGGNGADVLSGGAANDYLVGDAGFDQLWGGIGDDRLLGGEGTNDVRGEAGNDALVWEMYGLAKLNDSLFDGGAGVDTLVVKTPGQIPLYPDSDSSEYAPQQAIAVVSMGANGDGYLGFACGRQEVSNALDQGEIKGIERIEVSSNAGGPKSMLDYHGGASNLTVLGDTLDDVFWLGAGNETIRTSGGHDIIGLSLGGSGVFGRDVIQDYDPGMDHFVVLHAEDRGLTVNQTEANGNTYIKAFDQNNTEVLDITLAGVTDLDDVLTNSQDWWG